MTTSVETTSYIDTSTLQAIGMVDRTVSYANRQWKIYSIQGSGYYAFQSAVSRSVAINFNMPEAPWYADPIATLLPVGAKIGEGHAVEVPLHMVRVGVCLAKR